MKRILIIIALLAAGCSDDKEPVKNYGTEVPKVLYEKPLNQFYSDGSSRGVSLPKISPIIVFTDNTRFSERCKADQKNVISTSYKDGDKFVIEISDKLDDHQNDASFYIPIYREMAHLLLDKPYGDLPTVTKDGVAHLNIMYPCGGGELEEESIDVLFE